MYRISTALAIVLACTALKADKAPTPVPLKEHRLNFSLLQFGYDFLKKDTVYTGFDLNLTPIWDINDKDLSRRNYSLSGEFRLGHHLGITPKDSLITYGSIGYTKFHRDYIQYLKEHAYFGVGAKFFHEFGPIFQMGVHVKGTRSLLNEYEIPTYNERESNKWGIEVGLPVAWHLGENRDWEIQLEPYFTHVACAGKLEFIGSRLTFGFRF